MTDEIMVSICCLTYNHEKYIRKALDGFINQITNFKYEILIHDDCSTDNTVKIIKEYEKKYPELIKPIYQTQNQFSKGIRVSYTYQFPRAKGKYIALCEGDDYWTDCNKLQSQFDAMEKHSNCTFCTHIVQYIDESGDFINTIQPEKTICLELGEGVISNKIFFDKIFFKIIIPFQTSSFFFKKEDIMEYSKTFLKTIADIKDFGDVPLSWYMLLKGDCYFINKTMSNYRKNSVSSISKKLFDENYIVKHYNDIILFLKKFNCFSNNTYDNQINKLIVKYRFFILLANHEYRISLSSEYRDCFKTLSLKTKIKIYVYAYVPFVRKIVNKIKK